MGFAFLLVVAAMTAQAGQTIGAAIPSMPGAIWADYNNDGYADGYVYNGAYYAGTPGSTGPAHASFDASWGILADIAEQDMELNGAPATVRWVVPNEKLLITGWYGFQNTLLEFKIDTATGVMRLCYPQMGGECAANTLSASPDGTIYLKGSKRIVWRTEAGTIKIDGFGTLGPITNNRTTSAIQKQIAAGRVRSANPQLRGTASKPQVLAEAPPTPIISLPPASAPAKSDASTAISPTDKALVAADGPRHALIIGNSQYGASLGRLPNPANDARQVAAALQRVGFAVDLVIDADQKTMKRAISRFGDRLAAGGRSATGLFYYAGHGIQSRGTNYLIPVSAPIEREADLDLEGVAADTVLAQMEEAGAGTSIVILDACRNMPLARSFRSASRGLARMDAPNGSFIAYSTAPGATAADGDGRNSPFAAALVRQLGQKGLPIEVMFRGIRRQVVEATGGQQTPWDSSSLLDPFYFVP